MFDCPACEGSEYDLVNGLYYCKTCGTLSEEHHEQEVDELEFVNFNFPSLIRKVRLKESSTTINRDQGRPWTIYEGYQCIILAQCDALISLGASEDLKEIVYTIWANYLSQIGIAFTRDEKVVPDIVLTSGFGRRRELHSGTLEKPWNRSKKNAKTKGDRAPEPDTEETVGCKRKADFDLSDSSSDEESTAFIKENNNNKYARKSPAWMDLKKTVVFCYIGLRYSNPEILLIQFLRWIYKGKVPYMSTSHLLNDDMVLSLEDQYLFMPMPLTVQSVIEEMDKITFFLSIKAKLFPAPSITVMIEALVNQLHLPDELSGVCVGFYKKVKGLKFERRPCSYPKTEFFATQFIALTLKMIFGLDDITEYELSEYAREAQKVIGSGGSLFVWDDWRSYQMRKEQLNFDLCVDRKYKYQHLDEILESYNRFHRENRRVRLKPKQKKGAHESKMESLTWPLTMAMAGCRSEKDPNAISDVDESLKKKFTKSTLIHLLNFDAFKTAFKDNMDKSSRKTLKTRRRKIYNKLVYESPSSSSAHEETFLKSRSNSYLWLIQFLSDFVGYNTLALGKALFQLQENLRSEVRRR